jgi:Protein of unknown function (DUF3168)
MAATIGNAIKAHIEGSGLQLRAYRDAAPANEDFPYVTIVDRIVYTPDGREDGGKANNVGTETVQVDLWERWRDVDGEVLESPTLADEVLRALHGSRLDAAPMRVYGVTVVSSRRLLDPAASIVHTAITATVNRLL